jgi:hypothetical protein
MGQRSIVLSLHLKGLSAHAIHDDLVAALGPKAVAYGTVTRCLREAKLGTAEVTLDPEPSSPRLDDSDQPILQPWKKRKLVFVHARTSPSHPYPTSSRLSKVDEIARVRAMSSSLDAARPITVGR